jgi:hypothetical protein
MSPQLIFANIYFTIPCNGIPAFFHFDGFKQSVVLQGHEHFFAQQRSDVVLSFLIVVELNQQGVAISSPRRQYFWIIHGVIAMAVVYGNPGLSTSFACPMLAVTGSKEILDCQTAGTPDYVA